MLTRDVPKRRFLPTLPRFEPLVLDHSATKVFKECPRKYFYKIVLGRVHPEPRNQEIFAWGNSIHKFMEVLYRTGDFDAASVAALPLWMQPPPDSKWKYLDIERLMLTFKALWDFYVREQRIGNVEVLGIEQPWNVNLPDGTQTGGRWDQLIKLRGYTYIRDWKTTTKRIDWFIPTLDPNDQATRYIYGASRLQGWTSDKPDREKLVEGIQFVIVKNMETKKSLGIEPVTYTRESQELIAWEQEQMLIYRTIDMYRMEDMWPKHETNCGWCDYRHVCTAKSDNSRAYKLESEYKLRPWNHSVVEQEEKV